MAMMGMNAGVVSLPSPRLVAVEVPIGAFSSADATEKNTNKSQNLINKYEINRFNLQEHKAIVYVSLWLYNSQQPVSLPHCR
jgi:hypothetical protein